MPLQFYAFDVLTLAGGSLQNQRLVACNVENDSGLSYRNEAGRPPPNLPLVRGRDFQRYRFQCYSPVVLDLRPALPRISDNVIKLLGKLRIIANDPVEGLVLPDAPKALMLALHLTGGERLPGMQNRFELVPGQRREKRMNMIIRHDISGELITLTVEALDRRHHQLALAGAKLLPTSSEPPGNRIGDLVLPPVRKLSPVNKIP